MGSNFSIWIHTFTLAKWAAECFGGPHEVGYVPQRCCIFKRDRSFVIVDCHVLDHALAVCVTCLTHEVDCCLLHTLHAVWAAPV